MALAGLAESVELGGFVPSTFYNLPLRCYVYSTFMHVSKTPRVAVFLPSRQYNESYAHLMSYCLK